MEIIELNRNTLSNLYEQYPESFKDLSLDDTDLVYAGDRIDISQFNINDLLGDDNQFAVSLSVLSSEDIFRIIRLHAIRLSSKKLETKEESLSDKVEIIRQENPLMANISVISRDNQNGHAEFINIVDSMGNDHLFENDRNVNIFAIYDILKFQNPGRNITPDELCAEINRRLYSIQLEQAENLAEKYSTSEDFKNKMNNINTPYKNDKMVSVMGNQEHDIAIIKDQSSPSEHRVVTFDKNQFGDLVVENHSQNISGTDTSMVTENNQEDIGFESDISNNSSVVSFENNHNNMVMARLISDDDFYRLLNSDFPLSQEERMNVDTYYAYLGDLIIYEDYLNPELHDMLNRFRNYVYDLEYGDNEKDLNDKQQEAINKNKELEENKSLINGTTVLENAKEDVRKLKLIRESGNNTGAVSTIQVIAFIVGIAIILTAVTLYLIS